MPKEVAVVNRRYYNQINNGLPITNYAQSASFFHGCVGSVASVELTWQLWWNMFIDTGEWSLKDENPNGRIVSVSGVNFIEEDFRVGDSLKIYLLRKGSPLVPYIDSYLVTILEVYQDQIVIDNRLLPTIPPDEELFWISLSNITSLDGAEYRFGINENDDTGNNNNIMTNESQSLYIETITNSFEVMTPLGESKSWQNPVGVNLPNGEDVVLRSTPYTDKVIGFGDTADTTTFTNVVHNFITRHAVKILPTFLEDEIENIEKGVPPPNLIGDSSYKYWAELELRRVYTDPNYPIIITEDDAIKGSIGWFGEGFNGYNPAYKLSSYSITDLLSNPIDVLDIAGSDIVVEIDSINPSYGINVVSLGYNLLTDEDSYVIETRNGNENTRYDMIQGSDTDNAIRTFSIIQNYTITKLSPTRIRIEARLLPNNTFYPLDDDLKADNTSKYLLYAVIGDNTKNNDVSGMQSILIDVNTCQENTDIPDLVFIDTYTIVNPVLSEYTDYRGAIEDTITAKIRFKTDFLKGATINSIALNFIGYDPIEQDFFIIKRNDISFESSFVSGKQNINLDTDRGFSTYDDLLDVIKLQSDNSDAQFQFYNLEYSTKIPFRENIDISNNMTQAQIDLFFDNTKPLNGLNQKCSQYSDVSGYEIRIALELVVESTGIETTYNLLSPKLVIFDYETIIT